MTKAEAITELVRIWHSPHLDLSLKAGLAEVIEALKGADGDLISRQDAIDALMRSYEIYEGATIRTDVARRDELSAMIARLKSLPSAEAVEVVRCKDCKHYKKINPKAKSGMCYKDIVASVWNDDGFCSRGKRKGGDDE